MYTFRLVIPLISLFIAIFYSNLVFANLTLNKAESQLSFVTFKNQHIAETHSFDSFSGTLNKNGNLKIKVNLASVNTMIAIRDERLKEILFDISSFSNATFEAQLDPSLLLMPEGTASNIDITGKLTISGKTVDSTFSVSLVALSNSRFRATTYKPTLIKAADFGLEKGIETLQNIAKLNSISKTVPLSFTVTFN